MRRILVRRFWVTAATAVLALAVTLYLLAVGALFLAQGEFTYPRGRSTEIGDPPADLPSQIVHFKTPDGETLAGWWAPPKPGRPVILMLAGNGGGVSPNLARWRQITAEGVGFLAFGYRGYDGSTGRPDEAGLYRDGLAAYDWLAARTPSSDIVIHGYSLGSAVATRVAQARPARALVLEAPLTSLAAVGADRYPWAPVGLLLREKFDNLGRIDQIHLPLLILHGTDDSVIAEAHSEILFARANRPKTLVRITGGGHSGLLADGGYDDVWRFLGLPATAAVKPSHQVIVQP
jgi:fermentation-respiration switch protein FrsA (DUF1100 family)